MTWLAGDKKAVQIVEVLIKAEYLLTLCELGKKRDLNSYNFEFLEGDRLGIHKGTRKYLEAICST
jgi:hypothetical protein